MVSAAKSSAIATKMAHPCRSSLTIRPKVKQRAAGMSRIASSSSRLLRGVGFSRGWAELTLKNPPPLVPSCLMATCEAAGPTAIAWVVMVAEPAWYGSSSVTSRDAAMVCTTPCDTRSSASTLASGSRMYSTLRVESTQAFPRVPDERR